MTILAFIDYGYASSSIDNEDSVDETKQWILLSIGILGIVSTILSSIMINTKYQSQQSMHAAAERSLSKICQQVRFPGHDGSKSLANHINTQKGIYLAMSYADMPTKISQPFRDLQHVMNNKPYMFRAIQYERCYYYLYKSYGKKRYLWPMYIREVNVLSSSNNLGRLIEEEYAKYTKGMEEVIVHKKSSIRSIVVDDDSSGSRSRRLQQRRRSSNVHSVKSDHSNSSDEEYEEFQQSLLRRSSSTASSTTAAPTQDPPV